MARATRLWVKLKIHRCNSCISWAKMHSQTSLLLVLDRLANPTLIQRQAALLVQPVGLVADYLHPAALVLLGHIEQAVVNLVIEIDSSQVEDALIQRLPDLITKVPLLLVLV